MASHGYIVAGIDHTYNTFATEFPDGRVTTDATSALFSPDQDYNEETAARDRLGEVLTEDAADKKDELERMREAVDYGGQALYIDGTEHLNFTDVPFVSPAFKLLGAAGPISPKRADAVIDAYMLDFFDTYSKGQKGELPQGTNSRFPEVRFLFEKEAYSGSSGS